MSPLSTSVGCVGGMPIRVWRGVAAGVARAQGEILTPVTLHVARCVGGQALPRAKRGEKEKENKRKKRARKEKKRMKQRKEADWPDKKR